LATINERIAECIKESGLTKTAFAEKLGVTQPFVSKLCKGVSVPSDRTIRDIAEKFHINELWLRTGEGEMLRPRTIDDDLSQFFASLSFGGDDSFKRRLISVMARLDENDWKTLEKLARELAEK